MHRTLTAIAGAGVLGLALAASCGSTSSGSGSQTVAYSAPITGHHRAGLAHGCQRVLFTAGDANRPAVVCYGLKQPPAGQRWNLVFDGTTSFTVHRGTVIEAFPFTPPASAAAKAGAPVPVAGPQSRRTGSTFDEQDEWFGDCQRDPSSGGLGTVVVNSSCGTSNAMDWSYQANGTCGGKVTATCPGGPISASSALRGDFIITIRNIGQGSLCEGADAQTNWTMQMFTCDGVGGVHHYNNLWIWSQTASCSGGFSGNDLISYQWNQNGNSDTASIYNPGGTGSNVEVAPVPPHCPEALWRLNGS